jgi:Lrp/AsnC family transcriptional regulator, leucine-responsive regulatory protein
MADSRIDGLDRRILAVVQENNLVPHRQIADAVGLSTPAVTRRLKRLRADGLIREDVSVLDSGKLERPLTIIATVVVESEKLEELDAMRDAFSRCPQIQHCHYVTGEADFIVIFNVSNMAEYEDLTRKLFFGSGNVKRFTTFVSMDAIKSTSKLVI